jgi:acetyl esterase/lipase
MNRRIAFSRRGSSQGAHQPWRSGLVLLTLLALTGCMPPLGDSDAALALEDIVAGRGASRLKATTPEPVRRLVSYEVSGRDRRADLYLPRETVRAGIVLVPGVVAAGKDDVRLVALARTLARLQFAVLVPDLGGLREYRVRAANVRAVADAFHYLASRRALVPEGRAGIAGFSYGAGPVLLAALEPDVREQVHFVVALGGYYDVESVITYFTTGYYREEPGGPWRYRHPNPYIKWVFTLSNADLLEHQEDRDLLRRLADEVRNGRSPDPREAILNQLHPGGRALYALLINADPDRVPELVDRLPERIRTELEGIDPATHDLSALHAQAIVIHGRSDTMIPYSESLTLARVLPKEQVQLFVIEGFAHVDVEPEPGDIPQLLSAMQALLAQRVAAEP